MIADGKFSGPIPVAKMRVQDPRHPSPAARNTRPTIRPKAPGKTTSIEALPARYNDKSDITLDVKRGKQEVKYDLQSK